MCKKLFLGSMVLLLLMASSTMAQLDPASVTDVNRRHMVAYETNGMMDMPNTTFEDEIKYFEDNLTEFLTHETLRGKYVAIFNQQIIDKGSDRIRLMKRVYAREGYKPILFKKVTRERKFVRLRSPKLR